MKTQLRKPACERARYTEQYKQEALELWRGLGLHQKYGQWLGTNL